MEHLRHAVELAEAPRPARPPLEVLVARVCRQVGIAPAALRGGGRRRNVQAARAG